MLATRLSPGCLFQLAPKRGHARHGSPPHLPTAEPPWEEYRLLNDGLVAERTGGRMRQLTSGKPVSRTLATVYSVWWGK